METNGIEGKKKIKKKEDKTVKRKEREECITERRSEQMNQRKLNYKSSWDSDKTVEVKEGNKKGKESLDQ